MSTHHCILAIHFRSLTQICRYQSRLPESLRARGDWPRALPDALGMPRASQRFLQFQWHLRLMGMLAPRFPLWFHTSYLCSTQWSQKHSSKPSVILPLLPTPPQKKKKKSTEEQEGFPFQAAAASHWASLALKWQLISPTQDMSSGPASLVTHLRPVFGSPLWLPS